MFTDAVRREVLQLTRWRMKRDESIAEIARSLGIKYWTLCKWLQGRRQSSRRVAAGSLLPVKLESHGGVVGVSRRHTVRGPRGLWIEGLSTEEVADLWRRLT